MHELIIFIAHQKIKPGKTEVMLSEIRKAGVEHGQALLARGELTQAQWNILEADLNCCLEQDLFNFVMVVERRDGVLLMNAITKPK